MIPQSPGKSKSISAQRPAVDVTSVTALSRRVEGTLRQGSGSLSSPGVCPKYGFQVARVLHLVIFQDASDNRCDIGK